jgi:hypothetical protein
MTKSSKLFKKRKFRGNQYSDCNSSGSTSTSLEPVPSTSRPRPNQESETGEDTEHSTVHSASFTKLGRPNESVNSDKPVQHTYIVIDLDVLCENIKNLAVCKECGGEIILCEDPQGRMGCATKVRIYCKGCEAKKAFMSCTKAENGMYDLNLRFVYALRSIGSGLEDGKMLCTLIDIPGPPSNFMKYNRAIEPIIKKVADECMIEAVQEVTKKTESTDIAVAVDGSWQKRGFSSLNGVVTVTGMETGKVLDVHVLSKYCQGCKLAGRDPEKLAKHERVCELNYEGSSGGMEVAGARALFCRSQSNRGVRYLTYLGDGDSKGYEGVCEAKPYGPDVSIEKAECIGHVKKRMGARLRTLRKKQTKDSKLGDGKGLSGKGRLTLTQVDNLQEYYGQAIKKNCHSVAAMKNAIWSIYHHKRSTDKNPHHHLCPKGESSWCGYNRALVTKEKYSHKNSLPQAVMTKIKPIFKDLSNPVLLSRCKLGQTQNPNESFNGLIWKRLPKTVFCGLVTMRIGVYDAVLAYNKGASSKSDVLKGLGLKCSDNVSVRLQRCDLKRVIEAERKTKEEQKRKRKFQRIAKIRKEDAEKYKDYAPGGF